MRKNGVDRALRAIDGGVCAPSGFRAGAAYGGFGEDPDKADIALIMAERRCAVACVFARPVCGAPSEVTKRHIQNGFAQAILANGGSANAFAENGKDVAVKASRLLARCAGTDAMDTVMASTGKMLSPFPFEPFERGIPVAVAALGCGEENSLAAAEAVRTTGKKAFHAAYEFELGDYACKIGAIFKGGTHVAPNMATTLALMTTDVAITSEMLQKALRAAVADTLDMLQIDGVSSPNDMACVLANGRAGNYRISREDSEYKKFAFALKEVCKELCRALIAENEADKRPLICSVRGARSVREAREIAKSIAASVGIRRSLERGVPDAGGICRAVTQAKGSVAPQLKIVLRSECAACTILEEGALLPLTAESFYGVYEGEEIVLELRLGEGNYSASSYMCGI